MVLLATSLDLEDKMSQIVPSAGFTPPFDYSNFADTFDLSLLPTDLPLSPSTNFYTQSPPPSANVPKIVTSFHHADDPLGPDFQKLLNNRESSSISPQQQQFNSLYLEVPSTKNYHANSPAGALSPYSPHSSISYYPNSPNSYYSQSPRDEFFGVQHIKQEYIKQENYSSCPSSESSFQTGEDDLFHHLLQSNLAADQKAPVIKQESTVDFSTLLQCEDQNYPSTLLSFPTTEETSAVIKAQHQDHQLLREALNDTSFQKKFNIRPIDFGFISGTSTKMEEDHQDLAGCSETLTNDSIEPVLNLAFEQMKKDVDKTCITLGISPDPCKWTRNNVISWLQWTSREFRIPEPIVEQWDITGSGLLCLSEEEFIRRSPEGGAMLYAQLEIWKAAFLEDMQWIPEITSSASCEEISDDEEDDTASSSKTDLTSTIDTSNSCPSNPATPKPITPTPATPKATAPTTTSSHIHLWQFLKELLATPHLHGSGIRWLDRTRGIFKIEDSVKVARLWGKRKNRPAMNYDKLSRSIRQYYKKGIMKKTERSQRLVYQFCHPYSL